MRAVDREGDVKQLTALFDACFRIQREAIQAASAAIAKIPLPLASHIARYWYPRELREVMEK